MMCFKSFWVEVSVKKIEVKDPPEYLSEKRGFSGDRWVFKVTLFVFGLLPLPRGNWKVTNILKKLQIKTKMLNWLEKSGNQSSIFQSPIVFFPRMLTYNREHVSQLLS